MRLLILLVLTVLMFIPQYSQAHDQEYYHKHKSSCHFDRYSGKYICYFD